MDPLDDLFARLRTATAPAEVEALQHGIWQHWLDTGDAALNKTLEAGMRALAADDPGPAIREFTRLIEARPAFAEGWNKRATAHYQRGQYRAALLDIAETLRREPRHFGALAGKVTILRLLGDGRRALRVLRRLARLCPHLPGVQAQLRDLQDEADAAE